MDNTNSEWNETANFPNNDDACFFLIQNVPVGVGRIGEGMPIMPSIDMMF